MDHMYGNWNSSWDWAWMTLMMLFWLAVLGGVIYAAIRIALHDDRGNRTPRPNQ